MVSHTYLNDMLHMFYRIPQDEAKEEELEDENIDMEEIERMEKLAEENPFTPSSGAGSRVAKISGGYSLLLLLLFLLNDIDRDYPIVLVSMLIHKVCVSCWDDMVGDCDVHRSNAPGVARACACHFPYLECGLTFALQTWFWTIDA